MYVNKRVSSTWWIANISREGMACIMPRSTALPRVCHTFVLWIIVNFTRFKFVVLNFLLEKLTPAFANARTLRNTVSVPDF